MNQNFPRIITQLRKEKRISQKQAASELDISQSLLSHYEKGKRECSFDFLVKIADYYEVSTDYLLGRSTQRHSEVFSLAIENENKSRSTMTQLANKRIITNSISILHEYLIKIGSRKLSNRISDYLMLSVYMMFRLIYSSNPDNPPEIFSLNKNTFKDITGATMQIIRSKIDSSTDIDNKEMYVENCSNLKITPEGIAEEYPDISPSLFSLISNSENTLKSTIKNI